MNGTHFLTVTTVSLYLTFFILVVLPSYKLFARNFHIGQQPRTYNASQKLFNGYFDNGSQKLFNGYFDWNQAKSHTAFKQGPSHTALKPGLGHVTKNYTLRKEEGWIHSNEIAQDLCQDSYHRFFCSKTNMTFVDEKFHEREFKKDDQYYCPLLNRKGINKIFMQGDSFIRHTFLAMLLILTETPDLSDAKWISAPECKQEIAGLEGPFNEPVPACRNLVSSYSVCGGGVHVQLNHDAFGFPPVMSDQTENGTIIIWGIGNHPLDMDYSNQQKCLNVDIFNRERFQPACQRYSNAGKKRILWMPPHISQASQYGKFVPASVKEFFKSLEDGMDSVSQRQDVFALESIKIFQQCGIHGISTRDLTLPLSHASAKWIFGTLAGDMQHYGRTVNLLKARTALNHLIKINF